MSYIHSDPRRANDAHALPDVEVFYDDADDAGNGPRNFDSNGDPVQPGWYWWSCLLGCLPDGEPNGPFATEQEAIDDARDSIVQDDDDGVTQYVAGGDDEASDAASEVRS